MKAPHRPPRLEILAQGQACAERCARKYARWYGDRLGIDYADLVSVAYCKVVEREKTWDHTRGVPFAAYVYPFVRAALRHVVRRRRREVAIGEFLGATVGRAVTRLEEGAPAGGAEERPRMGHVPRAAVRYVGAEIAALTARLWSGTEAHQAELEHSRRTHSQITRCLTRLPSRLRRLWRWHFVQGRALGTFARVEGLSTTRVAMLRDRLLRRLRRALETMRLLAPLALSA